MPQATRCAAPSGVVRGALRGGHRHGHVGIDEHASGAKRLGNASEQGSLFCNIRHMVQGQGGSHRIATRQRLVE